MAGRTVDQRRDSSLARVPPPAAARRESGRRYERARPPWHGAVNTAIAARFLFSAFVDALLKFHAGFEEWNSLCSDANRSAGFGITDDSSSSAPRPKAAESA